MKNQNNNRRDKRNKKKGLVLAFAVLVCLIGMIAMFRTVLSFEKVPEPEKYDVIVRIHDQSSVYGEELATEFDFDFEIVNQRLIISKNDLKNMCIFEKAEGDEVGTYTITGKLRNTSQIDIKFINGMYTITKARYDMSGIKFEDATFKYDGQLHKIEIQGELPEGVAVKYANNEAKEIGEYDAIASFEGDYKNYYTIPNMTAKLVIGTQDSMGGDITIFDDDTIISTTKPGNTWKPGNTGKPPVENKPGNPSTPDKPTNPDDQEPESTVDVVVYVKNVTTMYGKPLVSNFDFSFEILNKDVKVTKAELAKNLRLNKENGNNAGKYAIFGEYTNTNLKVNIVPGTYTITKAKYDMSSVAFKDATFKYDGKNHCVLIEGQLPEGVTVTYVNNQGMKVGKYVATAKFAGDTKNYEPIPDMFATLTIEAKGNGSGGSSEQEPPIKQEDVVVYINDETSVYGEPIVQDFDFNFKVLNKDIKVTKQELAKKLTISKEAGKNAGKYAINGTYNSSDLVVRIVPGTYTIQKAVYDMSQVSFNNKTAQFAGKDVVYYVTITGTLPEGVSVHYRDNTASEVGTYHAVAIFTGDYNNYYMIPNMTATLTITLPSAGGDESKDDTENGVENTPTLPDPDDEDKEDLPDIEETPDLPDPDEEDKDDLPDIEETPKDPVPVLPEPGEEDKGELPDIEETPKDPTPVLPEPGEENKGELPDVELTPTELPEPKDKPKQDVPKIEQTPTVVEPQNQSSVPQEVTTANVVNVMETRVVLTRQGNFNEGLNIDMMAVLLSNTGSKKMQNVSYEKAFNDNKTPFLEIKGVI
ncbi:MAG: hypothetical protein HFJ55_06810 [Clostridia bacterium]|nr:hypothetical protein [Clostridia bacterium]